MQSILNDDFLRVFSHWLKQPATQMLLAKEQAYFTHITNQIFGFHAVQLGFPLFDALQNLRIQHKMMASPPAFNPNAQIFCDVDALPFASESMDLVILPHVLEFSADPKSILREMQRILIPEGHLLISGFHPYSLGMMRRFLDKKNVFPWCGHFISPNRLKDWLSLLGLDVQKHTLTPFYSFSLPAVYTLHAIKHVCGIRLIAPNFPSFHPTAPALSAKTFGVLQCLPKFKK